MFHTYDEDISELDFSPRPNTIFQAWTFADGRAPLFRKGQLREEGINDWLFKRTPEFKQPDGAFAGLRIISCASNRDFRSPTLPFTGESFENIVKTLRLPKYYPRACMHKSFSHFAAFSTGDSPNEKSYLGFIIRTLTHEVTWSLALSYEVNTRITNVIVRGLEENYEGAPFANLVEKCAHLAGYPMLVPFIMADILTTNYETLLTTRNYEVIGLERQTGQHPYIGGREIEPEQLDFLGLTKSLNQAQRRLGMLELRFESLVMLLDKVQTTSDLIESLSKPPNSPSTSPSQFKKDSKIVAEHSCYLTSRISHMQLRVEDLKARCSSQLAVVYNFMALNESRISQKIADDSNRVANDSKYLTAAAKKDSSAMLGIALLTMVFLPPTFVSTLFAVPMFDWQAGAGQRVVSNRFWVYWVITAPLTMLVLAVYFSWMQVVRFGKLFKREKGGKSKTEA